MEKTSKNASVKIPQINLKSGTKIPVLGFGTWLIGGDHMGRNPDNDDVGQIKSMRYAIDKGFRLIRTAHNYADGYCEVLVGRAIKSYDRKDLFIISAANQRSAFDEKSLVEVAKGSLKSLDTDYFDMYIIGAVNPDTSLKSVLDGLMHLKKSGLAKEIGVSNYRLPELQAAYDYLGKELVYSEMHYNLVVREPEICGALNFCREKDIILGAYRPLQLGQLSKPGILILDELAKKYNKSQSQISLKWLLQQKGVITMTKALKPEHIDEDLDSFDWELSKEDMERLTRDFPIQMRMSDCSEPRVFKF
jgi:diketogulonate reductase-like aldo/keto reductase